MFLYSHFSSQRDGRLYDQKFFLLTAIQKDFANALNATQAKLSDQLGQLQSRIESADTSHKSELISDWKINKGKQLTLLSNHLLALDEDHHVMQTQNKFLDGLHFPSIQERKQRIPEAHENTFRWIFQHDDFKSWLEGRVMNSNVLWVSGKAGSGKSCLMRFIESHPSTRAQLQSWSNEKDLSIAGCFFWRPGTDMQKSFSGLLRSLLHQLCSQNRRYIEEVDTVRYRAYYTGESRERSWTDVDLKLAFDRFLDFSSPTSRVALFIDGLDEFEGTYDQIQHLVEILLSLKQRPNHRIYVSSRPLNVFQDAFADCATLRLELLTYDDINSYVENKLRYHPAFRNMGKYQSGEQDRLCGFDIRSYREG